MKNLFLLFAIGTGTILFASCDKDHTPEAEFKSIENRAKALGYESIEVYQDTVAVQCAAGNHINCDPLADGTHQACAYENHSGEKHDGTNHNGSDHNNGTNHNSGNHNKGNHNKGKHH